MGTTFDVFIDSAAFYPSAPKSAAVVEALWRRREPVPGAGSGADFVTAARDSVKFALTARDEP